MNDDLIDQVLRMAFMNQHIYSKVQFDNAKDTEDLLKIAEENAKMMMNVSKSRLIPYIDELLEKKLREITNGSGGKISIVLGDGKFVVLTIKEES